MPCVLKFEKIWIVIMYFFEIKEKICVKFKMMVMFTSYFEHNFFQNFGKIFPKVWKTGKMGNEFFERGSELFFDRAFVVNENPQLKV